MSVLECGRTAPKAQPDLDSAECHLDAVETRLGLAEHTPNWVEPNLGSNPELAERNQKQAKPADIALTPGELSQNTAEDTWHVRILRDPSLNGRESELVSLFACEIASPRRVRRGPRHDSNENRPRLWSNPKATIG